ncbi:MAG: Hpt domain-containing protein [Clostridia bacterium]|nr:Hpt domain-containing protein [Clostridia bacterium]
MLTIETLKQFGADVDTGLARCAGNEGLYLRLVNICVQELSENELEAALGAGELEKAFEIAHRLKGGVSNLALTPIETPVCELTELLRHETPGDYDALCAQIVQKTKELAALV